MASTAMTSIRVGATLSQSGTYALQGRQALQGLLLWIEETNAHGGLAVSELTPPVRLQLLTYDDHSRRADLEHGLDSLITRDHVDILIGPYSSGLTRTAAAIAEAQHKVLWNHGGSSDAIMRQGSSWLVNLPTPASRYFAGLFPCLRRYLPQGQRIAIVERRGGTFAHEVASGARQQAEACGFLTLPSCYYPADRDDMQALAVDLAKVQPAAIVAVGRYADDVALVRALGKMALGVQVLAAVAAPMQAFWEDLHATAEGCIGPSQWELSRGGAPDIGPTSAAFVERFRRRFGESPDYPAAQAYAMGLIIARCVAIAGTSDDEALLRAAQQLDCRTFYGRFRLDPETGGQIGHETVLVQWQDGVKCLIGAGDVAEVPLVAPKPWVGRSSSTAN
jgi:branched-chain amino acid transport system substrate-binding protein